MAIFTDPVQSTIPTNTDTEAGRVAFPAPNAFRPFVTTELKRRRSTYPTAPVTPFVRFISTKQDVTNGYQFFSLGLHGWEGSNGNLFDQIYSGGNDIVGYGYSLSQMDANGNAQKVLIHTNQLAPNESKIYQEALRALSTQNSNSSNIGTAATSQQIQDTIDTINQTSTTGGQRATHPVPGIMSVNVNRVGYLSPLISTVVFKCYNRAQLEFLRNHFMILNSYVVIEYGNQFADRPSTTPFNFGSATATDDLVNILKTGRLNIIQKYNSTNNGNYDFIIGNIGNYKVEYESSTQAYICTITVVTIAEALSGLMINTTITRTDPNNTQSHTQLFRPATIADYFLPSGQFDRTVNVNRINKQYVSTYATKANISHIRDVKGFQNESNNPMDYVFISWQCFAKVIIPELIKVLVQGPNTNDILSSILDLSGMEKIGNAPGLKTTRPETLIIAKSELQNTAGFTEAGFFDSGTPVDVSSVDPATTEWGRLAQGIWLNTGAIRECFSTAQTFKQGLEALFNRMNLAVANYWDLRLYHDELTNTYKILDFQYANLSRLNVTDTSGLKFYRFNYASKGDLLELDLSSAFPPAVTSMMAMAAYYNAPDQATLTDKLKNTSFIGTTSPYAFALNWTSLVDVVRQKNAYDTTGNNVSNDPQPQSADSNPQNGVSAISDSSRIKPFGDQGFGVGNSTSVPIGTTPGTNTTTMGSATVEDANTAGIPITNVSPIMGTKLQAQLNNGSLSSDFQGRLESMIASLQSKGYTVAVDNSGIALGRTQAQQATAFAQGRTTSGTVITDADGVNIRSNHQDGNAADLVISDGDGNGYATMKSIANGFGLTTISPKFGSDPGHIELQKTPMTNPGPQAAFGGPGGRNSTEPVAPTSVADSTQQRQMEINQKFGNTILPMVEVNESSLRAKIVKTGMADLTAANAFIAPFPTLTEVSVSILGIAGISMYDGFYVDKIPFLFERYGIFRVLEITDNITPSGWTTKLRGTFTFLWLDGSGPKPKSDI